MWISDKTIINALHSGSTEAKRVDYLDGWRGLAIGIVLVSHFLPITWLPIERVNLGRFGVDIFFVLSGLLMSRILYVKRVPLGVFYKRRISRILPTFFIYVSLLYGILYLLNLSDEAQNYLYTLFFIRSYVPVDPGIWRAGVPIEHLWSLNVEEHCYVLMGLLTFIAFLKGREYLALFFLGGMATVMFYLYLVIPDLAPANFKLRTEVVANHILISAGYFLVKHKVEAFVRSWMVLLAFGLALLCYTNYTPGFPIWVISPFLLAFVVSHLDKLNEPVLAFLSCKLLRMLGIWSFSIYVWQQPFYHYGVKGGEIFPFAGPVLLVLAVVVGVALFYIVENPMRRWINERW